MADAEELDRELAWVKIDLDEAQLEIKRHHADFQRIRDALDAYEGTDPRLYPEDPEVLLVRTIRNIVG